LSAKNEQKTSDGEKSRVGTHALLGKGTSHSFASATCVSAGPLTIHRRFWRRGEKRALKGGGFSLKPGKPRIHFGESFQNGKKRG